MKFYKSHKIVRAGKIEAYHIGKSGAIQALTLDNGEQIPVKEDFNTKFRPTPPDLGYYVLYKDGYESWSPSEAFEEGYEETTETEIIKGGFN